MKRSIVALALAGTILISSVPLMAQQIAPDETALSQMPDEVQQQYREIEQSLRPQTGVVKVPGANASFDLGSRYYFLGPEDARKVIVDGWGNPPEHGEGVLGLIMPAGAHFYDDGWGAIITFEETGYVSDKEAANEDYAKVLADIKSSTEDGNEARKSDGYTPIHVIDWAQPPTYDSANNTLIWAQNIQFEGEDVNTLNYDVRKLTRTGVLSINMVSTMDHLNSVRDAADSLARTASLDEGSRYADFNPDTDDVAGYGLAGLVAAGAGLAAKKAGLLGFILIFLKKGIAFIIAGAVAVGAWLKRRFSS